MAREDLHFRLRIPEDLKQLVEAEAERNNKSMTAEIVARLEMSFNEPVMLPEGLRERISAYASRHERTVTEEVIRLMEREFPVQWPLEDRLGYLADLLGILKTGASDDRIGQFMQEVEATLEALASGRITKIDERARSRLVSFWGTYKERENWEAYEAEKNSQSDLDEEELAALERNGTTEKFAEPLPPEPNPLWDHIYLMDVMPAVDLASLTHCLRHGDLEGAARVIKDIPKDELLKSIARAEELAADRLAFERRDHVDPFPPYDKD